MSTYLLSNQLANSTNYSATFIRLRFLFLSSCIRHSNSVDHKILRLRTVKDVDFYGLIIFQLYLTVSLQFCPVTMAPYNQQDRIKKE